MHPRQVTIDGNEAVASIAHRTNEVIAIYPITPASPMGELADAWSAVGRRNVWGKVPDVVEMQSEGGAAGAIHGSLQAGALTTTFTASQGLLLMIPNMYKIAGELTPCCIHVAARTVATHALSIFADHSDVMAARQTGFAMLCSSSVQEAHDFALVAQAATLKSRIPFLHFFDGFRTSHEIQKINYIPDEDVLAMLDEDDIAAHRARALTPERPVIRGTAQNPDAFFPAREACNPYYRACAGLTQQTFDEFAKLTGRKYNLYDYYGAPDAERVVVIMGSGGETVRETVDWLNSAGQKVGVVIIRLYRPFDTSAFVDVLPPSTHAIAVMDRTKEPGAVGDPLFLDVVSALFKEGRSIPAIAAGRYGLSSREFTPAMVARIFDELVDADPRSEFTIGINDDVTSTSLEFDPDVRLPSEDTYEAVFFGLGSDGTVSANKNTIKIIGENTDLHTQGYFVYDSKKAGAMTVSHLRFGPRPIHAPYLIDQANFIGCHQSNFLERYEMLHLAAPGATFLVNSPFKGDDLWPHLSTEVQQVIIDKKLNVHTIDALEVAKEAGLGVRINTVMQTCFFALSDVIPPADAIAYIKDSIEKSYGKRGPVVVQQNMAAVDAAIANLEKMNYPEQATASRHRQPVVTGEAPEFVREVTASMLDHRGYGLPVSAFPPDGTWPTGTTQWEKRGLAAEIPVWETDVCIQCNWCALVCPHAAIRTKVYDKEHLAEAPVGVKHATYKGAGFKGESYTVQVAPDDCTGCHLCVTVCPAKDKSNPRRKALNMGDRLPALDRDRQAYRFFLELPEVDRERIQRLDAKSSQLLQPLFEYSGACAGCGETPYIKLLTQLFGDRLLIANATGCSSIYGGNLPTTPYTTNSEGRGPAWSNSLFEDNAEFGFGFRLAIDALKHQAEEHVRSLGDHLDTRLVEALTRTDQSTEAGLRTVRGAVDDLRYHLKGLDNRHARRLEEIADSLIRKSVWLVGGDGWAYDIGYGGLDHVLAQDRDVNILVMDTEVYSNTGGQQSKATPLGASAKFAMSGKEIPKKDLGMEAMAYGHVYVARVAFGANQNQLVNALAEADAHRGPSLVICYAPCIAHGYDLRFGCDQQKLAVDSGVWPLYRYDPARNEIGEPPLKLDSGDPRKGIEEYMRNETRFRIVEKINPDRYARLQEAARKQAADRWTIYKQMAGIRIPLPTVEQEVES